jgi:N-acetylmuramoyl-L-alanine amidase CwlA
MNIIQRLIPKKFENTRPGTALNPTYITIHETDNPVNKANAEAHARLQENGNSRTASWHYQVDEQYVIQSIPDNEVAWHAGNKTGNHSSLAIEICVNADGDYKKAVKNAAELTKLLMKKYNIDLDHVVQHNKWSGKHCPRHLRDGDKGVTWSDFIAMLKEKPVEKPKAKVNIITGWYTEGSSGLATLEKFLKDHGWKYRKEIVKE